MKKLNITKEQFEKSRYFKNKYGKLEYVSESGKLFKTNKGKILKFVKESSSKYQESVGEAKWAVVVDDEIDEVFDSRDAAEEYASSLEKEDGVDALVRRMTETKSEGTESNPRFKCMENRRRKR